MTDHVIVLPGGGYRRHAPGEGEPVAEWLRGLGLEASVFAYPVKSRYPAGLQAVRAEVARVRDAGASRVGILGFSAGGHAGGLAALAPGAEPAEQIDIAILCYPVVSMLLPTHAGSRQNLLGPAASDAERAATSLDLLVTASAPPFFVWHTADDPVVPVQHTHLLGMALAAAGVPHEVHVYEHGRHGIVFGDGGGTTVGWRAACAAWLGQRGWIS
jgi:acetyl esterase/lipase